MSNTPNLRFARKQLLYISSLKNREGAGVVNECKTPDLGASKDDLTEFHREKMRNLRAWRRSGGDKVNSRGERRFSKSNDPAYRKSIWPEAKIATRKAAGE